MVFIPFELESSWRAVLGDELHKPYLAKLAAFIEQERSLEKPVYPPRELVFNAFYKTPYDSVKVVIVGQDPYHGPGQAHGLSFSVPRGIPIPPSLQNIYKEIKTDLGIDPPSHGCLGSWSEQGVLLLNATLTVRQGEPMSHHGKGWENFTDAVLGKLVERQKPIVFVLWGKSAQEKYRHLHSQSTAQHLILSAAHPSPFSAHQGFLGCRHFSKMNQHLQSIGEKPINWQVPL